MEKSRDAFRTISEVAEWLDVPTHVLRFWESRFSQIKPVKRAGGRRYYRPSDMALIGGIKVLLHDQGMTIRGVQKVLRENGIKHVAGFSPPVHGDGDDEDADVIEATAVALPETARPVSIPAPAASATREAEPAPIVDPVSDVAEVFESAEETDFADSADEGISAESDAPEDTRADPEGPDDSDADQPDMFGADAPAEAPAFTHRAPDPEPVPAPEPEPEEAATPAPAIPETPDVPAMDAADDDPGHDALPGLAARAVLAGLDAAHPASAAAATRLQALRARMSE